MMEFCHSCMKEVNVLEMDNEKYCIECDSKFANIATETEVQVKFSKKLAAKRKLQETNLTSFEAYELILNGWIRELRNFGFSKQFKKIVKNYWDIYRNSLFCKTDESVTMALTPNFHRKDMEIVLGVSFEKKKRKLSKSLNDWDVSSYGKYKSHFLTNSIIESKQNDEVAEDPNENLDQSLLKPKKFKELSRELKSGVLKLTKNKLLAFLYLAILKSGENCTLVELMKMIENQIIHAHDVKTILPAEKANDIISTYRIPIKLTATRATIATFALKLIRHLNLDPDEEFAMPSTAQFVEKFCTFYHLSDTVYKCADNLLSILPPKMTKFIYHGSTVDYEARAFAIILFVLKVIFVLDDYHEYILDSVAQKMTKNSFSVIDWLRFYQFRKAFFNTYKQFHQFNDFHEQIVEYCYRQLSSDDEFRVRDFVNDVPDELPNFQTFSSSSLKYIFKAKRFSDEYNEVDLSERFRRKIKYVIDDEKPIGNSSERVMPNINYVCNDTLKKLMEKFYRRSDKKMTYCGFNKMLSGKSVKQNIKLDLNPKICGKSTCDLVNDPSHYWIITSRMPLFVGKQGTKQGTKMFEKKIGTFPKTFSYIFREFANILGLNIKAFMLEFIKVEVMFFDSDVLLSDNSCKLPFLRRKAIPHW